MACPHCFSSRVSAGSYSRACRALCCASARDDALMIPRQNERRAAFSFMSRAISRIMLSVTIWLCLLQALDVVAVLATPGIEPNEHGPYRAADGARQALFSFRMITNAVAVDQKSYLPKRRRSSMRCWC